MQTQWHLFLKEYYSSLEQVNVDELLKNEALKTAYNKTTELINRINSGLSKLNNSLANLSPNANSTINIASSKLAEYVTRIKPPEPNDSNTTKQWFENHNFFLEYIVYIPIQSLLTQPKPPQQQQQEILILEDLEPPPGSLPRVTMSSNVRKDLWDITHNKLNELIGLTGTNYTMLPHKDIKDIAAFLTTLEESKLTASELLENNHDFYIVDAIPKNLESYRNSYFLVGEELKYITLDYKLQPIEISNMGQFLCELTLINPQGLPHLRLPQEQINTFISLSGGQPPKEQNTEFVKQKVAIFSLLEMIKEQYKINTVLPLWYARTHATEKGWPLVNEVENTIFTGTLSQQIMNGLSIGYLLSLGILPEQLQKAGISDEQLSLAGAYDTDSLNNPAPKTSEFTLSLEQPQPAISWHMVYEKLKQIRELADKEYLTLPAKEIRDITNFLTQLQSPGYFGDEEENCSLLPLVCDLNETYQVDNIVTVWLTRTHAEEMDRLPKEEIDKYLATGTLAKQVNQGLSIGYLLKPGISPEQLQKAGISNNLLRLAGIPIDSLPNYLKPAAANIKLENSYENKHRDNKKDIIISTLKQLNGLTGTEYIVLSYKEIGDTTILLTMLESGRYFDLGIEKEDYDTVENLLRAVKDKYKVDDILSLWHVRTHAQEMGYPSKERLYSDIAEGKPLAKKISDGLSIGYLLKIIPLDELFNVCDQANISDEKIRLAGTYDNSVLNEEKPTYHSSSFSFFSPETSATNPTTSPAHFKSTPTTTTTNNTTNLGPT